MSEGRRRHHPPLAGLALGLLVADLLLGLNPHLLGPIPTLRLFLVLGLAGLLASLPFALRGGEDRRADAPVSGGCGGRSAPAESRGGLGTPGRATWVVAALTFAAFGAYVESQRRLYHECLPNGSRRVLVAASVAAAAAALVALASAIRRPEADAVTRRLVVLAILCAAPPLAGRRAADRAGLTSPPAISRTVTRSLLVIGVEGVSWELLSAMSSEGSLPVIGRLLREGAGGPLGSQAPYERAALWTSVATGKKPSTHGVVTGRDWPTIAGRLVLLPRFPDGTPLVTLEGVAHGSGPPPWRSAGALRPPHPPEHGASARWTSPPRKSLCFWEILAMRGHGTALLNWPAAAPPREGLTLWAAEPFFGHRPDLEAALPEGAARKAQLFRVEVENLDRPLLRALRPAGLPVDGAGGAALLVGAARDLSVAGATLGSLPSGPRNVSALVFTGLADPARQLGPAAEPARYWGVRQGGSEPRVAALRAYYRFLDDVLGDLLEREGRERTLCLFSPVSFGPPTTVQALAAFLRGRPPRASPDAGADGFLLLSGSGIRSGVRLTSAHVLDLAPTLLVLAGEPIARDMDGRVLAEAFDERFNESTSIPVIDSFERER